MWISSLVSCAAIHTASKNPFLLQILAGLCDDELIEFKHSNKVNYLMHGSLMSSVMFQIIFS